MRRVTRNLLVGLALVVVALLALGALPSTLQSGDPYYLTATPVVESGPAVDAADLPAHRYPYTTAALGNATDESAGRSAPYWRGPLGVKEAFTHSPFDELSALRARAPAGADGAYVARNGTRFRLAVTEGP